MWRTLALMALALLAQVALVDAFQLSTPPRRKGASSALHMVTYPTKIKQVITKLTACTQKGLESRKSRYFLMFLTNFVNRHFAFMMRFTAFRRMEIELPPGADFGVEASMKQGSRKEGFLSNADRVKRSNREAARLVTEMFSQIQSATMVYFPSEMEANDARIKWGATFRGQVFSIDTPGAKGYGKLHSRRASKQEQEAALLGSDGIYVPDNSDVLIVAGPRAKDIKKIKKLHEKVGDDALIIIMNARAAIGAGNDEDADFFAENFAPVLHYAPPLLSGWDRDLLLFHEFEGPWYLAEKLKENNGILGLGGSDFQTVRKWAERPETSEIESALKAKAAAG